MIPKPFEEEPIYLNTLPPSSSGEVPDTSPQTEPPSEVDPYSTNYARLILAGLNVKFRGGLRLFEKLKSTPRARRARKLRNRVAKNSRKANR